jgi:putative ABC transport system permease protein
VLTLALQTLRARRHGFAGAFVALAFAVALLTACGILMQTGAQAGAPVDRYDASPIVIAGRDEILSPVAEGGVEPLPERPRIRAALAERVSDVAGVAAVIADRSVPATVSTTAGRILAPAAGGSAHAHGWSSAALAPYTLVSGRPPRSDGEVVLATGLARGGAVNVGGEVQISSTAGSSAYVVVGFARPARAAAGSAAVFVTDALASRLVVDPADVDALGVLLDDGASAEIVARRIRDAIGDDVSVLVGDDRGAVAARGVMQRNDELISLAGAFAGIAIMLAVFVVAATLGLSVLQRSRELALLRAVGAKPRQIRRLLVGEAVLVAAAAGLVGVVLGVPLGAALFHALRSRGIGDETTTLAIGWAAPAIALGIGMLAAGLAAWIAGRRPSRVRPTAALAEAALEPRRLGWPRLLLGFAFLAGGAALCATAMSQKGESAAETSIGVVMTLMVAVGLLGPLLARCAAALGGPLIGRLSTTSGFLAQASLRTRARRFAAASTPLALAVAFSLAVVGTLTVEAGATRDQSRERLIADRVLTAPDGLPDRLLDDVRALPGITAVTGLLPTQVGAVAHTFDGRQFAFLDAVGVSPDGVDRTLDLDVEDGSIDLAPGTVAVGADRAHSLRVGVGDRLKLRLADGHRIRPRVVATYASTLGLGDIILRHDAIAPHVANPMFAQALVTHARGTDTTAADARLKELASSTPGVQVLDRAALRTAEAEEAETNAWVNYLVLGVLMAFCAVAVVNTLAMATAERSRELALLRLVGATPKQVTRMIRWEALAVTGFGLALGTAVAAATLIPFSLAMAGTAVPYLPWPFVVGVVALAATLGLAASELPTRAALRHNPAEAIAAPQ